MEVKDMIIENPKGQGFYYTRCGTLYGAFGNIDLDCLNERCDVKHEDLPQPVTEWRRTHESFTDELMWG